MTDPKVRVNHPSLMKRRHHLEALSIVVLFVAILTGAVWKYFDDAKSGPNYCGAVKEATCNVVSGGKYVVVKAGSRVYLVLVENGKIIFTEQKQ